MSTFELRSAAVATSVGGMVIGPCGLTDGQMNDAGANTPVIATAIHSLTAYVLSGAWKIRTIRRKNDGKCNLD